MTHSIEPIQEESSSRTLLWRSFAIGSSVVTIILLITVFLGSRFYYLKNFERIERAQKSMLRVEMDVSTLEQQIDQLAELVKTQDQAINALRQTATGYNRDEWRVLEAEFLVRLAHDKMEFENNTSQAIKLLESADQQIRDLSDVRFLPLRKALAVDIANLQTVPAVDVAGIYTRLLALGEQLNQLPLPNKSVQTAPIQPESSEKLRWWQRGLQQTWYMLRQIVVVRYNQHDVLPLLMPEQQAFLRQNMQAALEKAMWGLLHHQSLVYQASLQQLLTWINDYYTVDSPFTQNVLAQLVDLQKIEIAPSVPKEMTALQAFQDYIKSSSTTRS